MALKVEQPRNTQLDLFVLLFVLILLGASLTRGMGLAAFSLSCWGTACYASSGWNTVACQVVFVVLVVSVPTGPTSL
jgi:hypothetical protein